MPRACPLLHISGDCQSPLLSLSLPVELLCRSRKKHITATVKRRFYRILDDTNKKSVPSNLGTLS